ncbi:MAG: GntR family transcriptional regulator [Hyphomicrobiaceae bacterium]
MNAEPEALAEICGEMLDRSIPLRVQISSIVRRLIVTGRLKPGDTVNEPQIAKRLGVSRTPVREAVKRLSDEGLIDVFAQSGTFVTEISRQAIEEAFVIRTALELESVARAAPLMDARHTANLREIMRRHEERLANNQFADAIDADDEFHRYIAEVNNMKLLWRAVDISKAHMDRGRLLVLPQPGQGQITLRQHKAILNALIRRDTAGATEAMRAHLAVTLETMLGELTGAGSQPSSDAHRSVAVVSG